MRIHGLRHRNGKEEDVEAHKGWLLELSKTVDISECWEW